MVNMKDTSPNMLAHTINPAPGNKSPIAAARILVDTGNIG
jgi:hypothetical protein